VPYPVNSCFFSASAPPFLTQIHGYCYTLVSIRTTPTPYAPLDLSLSPPPLSSSPALLPTPTLEFYSLIIIYYRLIYLPLHLAFLHIIVGSSGLNQCTSYIYSSYIYYPTYATFTLRPLLHVIMINHWIAKCYFIWRSSSKLMGTSIMQKMFLFGFYKLI
jgi:hypothetical protein